MNGSDLSKHFMASVLGFALSGMIHERVFLFIWGIPAGVYWFMPLPFIHANKGFSEQ